MQKGFTHIVNHLASLGKIFPNENLINKVLRCLSTNNKHQQQARRTLKKFKNGEKKGSRRKEM